ncbi:MAG TPA: hypothetical protein VHF22_14995, partial [Planctomycetota bacterium]|nr:hypothetical protein [Planctomycetota bacterium]
MRKLEDELLRGRVDLERSLSVARLLLEELARVHARGDARGGFEPADVLLGDPDGATLAAVAPGTAGPAGDARGASPYVAPERRAGGVPPDARADVFSFGVVAYRLLTGVLPEGAFEPASALAAGLDPRWDAVIERCLRRAPENRYADARAALAAVRAIDRTPPRRVR